MTRKLQEHKTELSEMVVHRLEHGAATLRGQEEKIRQELEKVWAFAFLIFGGCVRNPSQVQRRPSDRIPQSFWQNRLG